MPDLELVFSARNDASAAISSVRSDVEGVQQTVSTVSANMRDLGRNLTNVGNSLTIGLTLPIVGVGSAAIKASTDLNEMMANVQSLGLSTNRVIELKSAVQDLAIEMGKPTEDMAWGLYQVISTFGDSAQAIDQLRIAATAGAAGLSTTADALTLIAAVTKGYGDSSIEAQQHASDLAFQTVNLGQTTFPELASSMGRVVPVAAALGVSQEELFAQMATLAGVTGSTAEVSTQLRSAYQSLFTPTTEMRDAIADVATELDNQGKLAGGPLVDSWRTAKEHFASSVVALRALKDELAATSTITKEGQQHAKDLKAEIKDQTTVVKDNEKAMDAAAAALGPVLVHSVGLTDTMRLLTSTAGDNTNVLGKMFGRVEALTAVLALTGNQSQSLNEKFQAMNDVAGVTNEAFDAQTQGLNKTGFEMQQLRTKTQVLLQDLGDALAPSLLKVLDAITPLLQKLSEGVKWFSELDAGTQQWILEAIATVAAIGPLLTGLGTLITTGSAVVSIIEAIGFAIGATFGWPIALAVAAVAGLYTIWFTDMWGIQEKAEEVRKWLDDKFTKIGESIGIPVTMLKGMWDWIVKLSSGDITLLAQAPAWIAQLLLWIWPPFEGEPQWIKNLVDWFWPPMPEEKKWVTDLKAWIWPLLPEVPQWVSDLISWTWPAMIAAVAWITELLIWHWPDFPSMPSWVGDLINWAWPSMPSWLSGNAQGTTNFGGGYTVVGENGPEIVALPRMSRIYNNHESNRLMDRVSGSGVSIVMQNVYIRDDGDIYKLAKAVEDLLRRRG